LNPRRPHRTSRGMPPSTAGSEGAFARMHCSARRAGYPSVSSRAARQQPRTRLAGGGPPHHIYAVDRLRHLRHRFRPPCGRAVPPVRRPVPARARNHRHRPWPLLRARARCISATATGPPRRPGGGASPGTTKPGWGTRLRHRARPPSEPGRCRPGRCPGGAPRATESPHVAVSRAPLGPSGERIAGLDRHCRARAPRARTVAVGQGRGRVALK
jgi:hypothetical protein